MVTLANTELLLKLFDGVEGRKTNCRLKRGRSVNVTSVTHLCQTVSSCQCQSLSRVKLLCPPCQCQSFSPVSKCVLLVSVIVTYVILFPPVSVSQCHQCQIVLCPLVSHCDQCLSCVLLSVSVIVTSVKLLCPLCQCQSLSPVSSCVLLSVSVIVTSDKLLCPPCQCQSLSSVSNCAVPSCQSLSPVSNCVLLSVSVMVTSVKLCCALLSVSSHCHQCQTVQCPPVNVSHCHQCQTVLCLPTV